MGSEKRDEMREVSSGAWRPRTYTQEEVIRRIRNDVEDSEVRRRRSRPQYSNWDFDVLQQFPNLGGPRVYVEPISLQERQLVEDLLNTFVGFRGIYIDVVPLTDPSSERNFKISPQVTSQPLRKMTEKILPLSSYYSRIVRFIQANQSLSAGRVNHALSSYLDEEMQEFYQMVTIMADRLGTITLSSMWADIQEFMGKLRVLHQIVTCVGGTRGGLALTALHENITMTMANQNAHSLFCNATKAGSVPYFESLTKWIYAGIIFDPFEEFMIIEKTQRRDSNNWDNIFIVDYNQVPSFLTTVVTDILRSGKYLDAIRNSLSFLEEMPTAERESISYDVVDASYLDSIRRACAFANTQLLHQLERRDIMGRLRTAKAFFSLEYGDLLYTIIENCMDDLNKLVSEVCQSNLQYLMMSSINVSSMKSLPYCSEVTVYLEKVSLSNQVLNLADPLSPTKSLVGEQQLGFDALTLKTVNKWPDCLIMHGKATKSYQMIFRHLVYVKLIHFKLARTHFLPMTVNQSILKHCALTYINSCLSYMTQGTIERNWLQFGKIVSSNSCSIEELRSCHDDFLYKNMSNCMLTSVDLYEKFRKTLDICLMFAEDQSEAHAIPFSDAVSKLVSAANLANLPGIGGFVVLVQPTSECTSSSSLSSLFSHIEDLTEESST